MSETRDAFLGGRLMLTQPRHGYRAATDPVFLAAACPAGPGDSVLELGCGVGAAILCLGLRVKDVLLTGVELQPAYAAMARRNADGAGLTLEVVEGDIARMPPAIRARSFDQVMINPPFYETGTVIAPLSRGRATAHVDALGLAGWCDAALRRLRPGGVVTMIQRAERLGDMLAALSGRAGDIRIRPVAARQGRGAGRVILRATKGARSPMRLLAPFVVHEGLSHDRDGDDFSAPARAVLREGAALAWD